MVPVRSCLAALVVLLPNLAVAGREIDNQQTFSELPFPAFPSWQLPKPLTPQDVAQWSPPNNFQAQSEELLGLSSQQLIRQPTPYAQGMAASAYSAQQLPGRNFAMLNTASNHDPAAMQATIVALQTQLNAERINEVQLANMAAEKQEEMRRVNASFAKILTMAEAGAEQEDQLQKQLANATAKNQALQAELGDVRDQDMQNKGEVMKLREEAMEAQRHVKQSDFLQKRAVHVMRDVQAAQEKVQRTEEIIRSLLPRLEPQLHVPATGPAVGQD